MAAFLVGSGLVSALGGLTTACAAYRAGLSRAEGARDAECFVKGDAEPSPVAVHAARLVTFGFTGVGRLTVLLVEAFRDLFTRVPAGDVPPGTPVFLALPDPLDRPVDPAFTDFEEEDARVSALAARLFERTRAVLGRDAPSGPMRAFGGGHAAFPRALAAAMDLLDRREAAACLVAAVDSLVESAVIQSLLDDGRLKVGDNAYGFTPGEAAAVHLLSRRAESLAAIGAVGVTEAAVTEAAVTDTAVAVVAVTVRHEPAHRGSDLPVEGRILADCVEAVSPAAAEIGLSTDHDGEPHRALEWGHLLFQLRSRGVNVRDAASDFPAAGFGNTGAASGAVALAVAARAIARGQSEVSSRVLVSSDDAGTRAAVLLQPAAETGHAASGRGAEA